jgi:membrane protein YqaA with SNARE-associated domain
MRRPGAAGVPRGQEAMLTSLVILVAFAAAWLIDGPSGVVLYPLIVVGAHAHSLTIVTGQ